MDRAKSVASEWTNDPDAGRRGSDFLQLDIGQAPPARMSAWLAEQIRAAVGDGTLPVGARLPASRTLAADLGVSRGVVTDAYQRLVDTGLATGRGRAGTIVAAAPAVTPPSGADRAAIAPPRDRFEALRAAPARIDLSPGVPDLAAFPRTAWLQAERRVLAELAAVQFGYGDPRGARSFRESVAGWLARNRGIQVDPDEVLVVAGVAQTLALTARVLRDRGVDSVAVEDPGSLGAREQLGAWGIRTPPVPVDAAGLDVNALRTAGAAAVLVTPAHQFPTGVVLDPARRRDLVHWARSGGLIIEDDYDAEHRYDHPPVAALHALAPEHVVYTGSVSKLLAPALRVGWLLAPSRLREALIEAKRHTDLGNAALPQLVLAELMSSGSLERHLHLTGRRHRHRRDAMITALARHLPAARVGGAAAGLHLTVQIDAAVDDRDWAAAALADGVKAQPLSWHAQRSIDPGLVLGYAAVAPGAIEEGVAGLAAALARLSG